MKTRGWAPAWVLSLAVHGCGTLAEPGEANRDLPNNRTGPFRPFTADESGGQDCVLTDTLGAVDEPAALRLPDGAVALYVSHVRNGQRTVARTVLRHGALAVGALIDVLTATRGWEGGQVHGPSVAALPDGTVAMAYAAAGGIGIARSPDGVTWTSVDAPVLTADPSQGEADAVDAPSLVVDTNGHATMAYGSRGGIFLAQARTVDGPWSRIDAVPGTPMRDPVLGTDHPVDGGVSFESGAVGEPMLTREDTSAGRTLWRLYYAARAPAGLDAGIATPSIGMAGSWDGVTFQRLGSPVLAPRTGNVAGPAVLPRDAVVTWMYVGADCTGSAGGRGVMGTVAPITVQLGAP